VQHDTSAGSRRRRQDRPCDDPGYNAPTTFRRLPWILSLNRPWPARPAVTRESSRCPPMPACGSMSVLAATRCSGRSAAIAASSAPTGRCPALRFRLPAARAVRQPICRSWNTRAICVTD